MPLPRVMKVKAAEPNVPYPIGNWTYISKPVSPVRINASQIPVGSDWTYVYPLKAGSTYRVYCYGDWIDYSSGLNKTDYDIYVYGPTGKLVSYHTESAGLPEHLGTTVDHPFFIPDKTGDYSFCIRNDARESSAADAATFMLIEHIETGRWYQLCMKGKEDNKPVEETSWAYEFNATSPRVEVWVDVPDGLDMYEARLYVMTNPAETDPILLSGMPLAWEPALYGETSGVFGGYNIKSDGLRFTDAIDSCEYPGQDMLINFSAPAEGNLLYHLVFIAENGEGTINFMVKTDFDSPEITLLDTVDKVKPNTETTIKAHVKERNILEKVTLNYTTDNWATSSNKEMSVDKNQIYNATIPGQPAGTTVAYIVSARDTSGNTAEAAGSYTVKNFANITLNVASPFVYYGRDFKVTGQISVSHSNVTVNYAMLNTTAMEETETGNLTNQTLLDYAVEKTLISQGVTADSSGNFSHAISFNQTGKWLVWATWKGTDTHFPASSSVMNFTVNRMPTSITCNVTSRSIAIGENITVTGQIQPGAANRSVTVIFISPNSTITRSTLTDENGTFILSWQPDMMGLWQIYAQLSETKSWSKSSSSTVTFTVTDTWLNQYLIYILGGAGGAGGVAAVVIIRKRRYE